MESPLLLYLVPSNVPRLTEITINPLVLIFSLGVSVLTGVLFGLAPAFQFSGFDLASYLKESARGASSSRRQNRVSSVLVACEFAICLILMTGAGLLLRSFWELMETNPGFNPQNAMVAHIWLPAPDDPRQDAYTQKQRTPFVREVLRRVRELPGISSAAMSTAVPMSQGGSPTWHQQTVATNLTGYGWPAIAWTGNAVIIAAIDAGGDLYYWWQAAGTTEWHQQHVASGLSPATPAAIAWNGNAVVIAAVDQSGNILYWWQASGKTKWHQQLVGRAGVQDNPLQGPPTYAWPVAIASTESFVGIVAVDSNGNLNFWQQPIGATGWSQTVVPPDSNSQYRNPDIASTGTSIVITAVDSSGNLYLWQQDPFGYLNRALVGGPQGNASNALPKISWNGSSPVIVCVDTEQRVSCWSQIAGPPYFKRETVASGSQDDGGYSFPAIVATPSFLMVTASTGSGTVNFWWQEAGSTHWHKETVANLN
jgi:hypothetical protein